jgi:DNA polymerase-3 subunit delta
MPGYKRNDVPELLNSVENGKTAPVYLVFGERYLCLDVANELVLRLLPDESQRVAGLKNIDGDQEDVAATVNLLKTYSLFGGRQVIRVVDSKILFSKVVAKTLWDKAVKANAAQDPKRASRCLGQMLALAEMELADWEQEEIAACSANRWQDLFGFAKPEDLSWVQALASVDSEQGDRSVAKGDGPEMLVSALEVGVPSGNVLILVAEAADKRKKLFKYLQKNCVVIDLTVDSGISSAARKEQEALVKELVAKTLAGFGKKLEPRALPVLLERVGFHPVAVVMEAEKLALYSGDAETITVADLNTMVGRTREEALYELNEAMGSRNLGAALLILGRLLENGVFPLVVIAGIRNFLRKLLLVRSFIEQPTPAYSEGMSYAVFQKGFLPRLKESMEEVPVQLSGHPFAVYKSFQQAERFSFASLQQGLGEVLWAEYRLKGSNLVPRVVLEKVLLGLLQEKRRSAYR